MNELDIKQDIAQEIIIESQNAIQKHGPQSHPNGTSHAYSGFASDARNKCDLAFKEGCLTWAHIFNEEFWEAMAEQDPFKIRKELIQVSAVCMNWIKDIDDKADL